MLIGLVKKKKRCQLDSLVKGRGEQGKRERKRLQPPPGRFLSFSSPVKAKESLIHPLSSPTAYICAASKVNEIQGTNGELV